MTDGLMHQNFHSGRKQTAAEQTLPDIRASVWLEPLSDPEISRVCLSWLTVVNRKCAGPGLKCKQEQKGVALLVSHHA